MGDSDAKWKLYPKYFLFESWDVPERTPEIMERASNDGIDLHAPDLARCIGAPPYEFQTGYLLSTHFGRVILAANRIGKSLSVLMEILITATGEIPFSLRYPRGHDTGISRLIDKFNIIRWGRRDKESGLILDNNPGANDDGSWDCGTVKGVGVFPTSKIVPPNSMIRFGSYRSLIDQNWWPAFKGETTEELGAFIPPIFINRAKGSYSNRGFDEQKKVVHLPRGVWLQMLSYEAEKKGFEGTQVPTYLDEEPPKDDIMGSVFLHSSRWSLSETPWRGITYSKPLAFPASITPQKKTFHASYYDCPFKTEEDRINTRAELEDKPWEIGARLWGIPTQQEGKPFYDRKKINFWINRYKMPYNLIRFEPANEWSFIKTDERTSRLPGLLDTDIIKVPASKEDERAVWRVYEDREAGVGYVEASDQAEGADDPTDAGDSSSSCIGRSDDDDAKKAVIVATLRSSLPTPQFTKECLYAARYYNNALIAPESGRGAANESFKMVAEDWPWWFKDSVLRQSTRKIRVQLGFCPTTDRRDAVFDTLIRQKLDAYDEEEYPEIPDEWILRELAASIVGHTRGGAARCDHPNNGTLDSAMAYGILLYVFQYFEKQIRCHGGEPTVRKKKSWLEQAAEVIEPKRIVYLGAGIKPLR